MEIPFRNWIKNLIFERIAQIWDMKQLATSCLLALSLTSLMVQGCGDIRPLWQGNMSMKDQGFTLHYSEDPVEFSLKINSEKEEVDLMLELVINYYVGIARNDLPLFIVLEDAEHNVFEYSSEVILKEDGEWMGAPTQNEIDYSLTHIAIPELQLKNGDYTLRIYANDEAQASIYGVVSVEARLYERAALEAEQP